MSNGRIDIVIADGSACVRQALSETLEECGYSVRTASEGLEALSEIRRRTPDILLADLNMPCMSGFELLSIVRRRYPKIKAIAMSGSYARGIASQGVAADAFYEKDGTGIAQLLLIVNSIKEETDSRLIRFSTPVWIPRPSTESLGGACATLACPECLRAYPCAMNETDRVHHESCPYCQFRVELAIFPANAETNMRSFIYYYS